MNPAPNPFLTDVIGAPADGTMPDCHPIEATVALDCESRVTITTAWEPTADDLAAMQAGAKVWLTLWTRGLPPAMITVGERPPY